MTDNKQMFVKDFIEILDAGNIKIEEMGWEYILNLIINRYFNMADDAKSKGYLASYRDYLHTAFTLMAEMDRIGLR